MVAVVGSVLVLAFFLFVDLGGTVSGTVHLASLVAATVWAGPFWIHARMVRTRTVALAGGVGLLVATTGCLVALFRDTHSTAGIGVGTFPVLLYPLATGVLAVDRLLVARRTGEPALRGFARRLLAVGLSFVVVISAIITVVGVVSLFDRAARGDVAASVISTVVSAVVTAGGAFGVRRLWRTAPPSPPRDSVDS